ncbi:hypothetical protein [Mucilaginibacter paludis]|uniref:Uncharacterized protein n=1 Tax=Mucilaginibacter paludis DSM 18603 TaxID=714943 RepID=H1Y255_9SPHI|nr:hypothetical protein [Mucilaginibacter paludis]EHQ26712.1 hypothetical protein Mucpa_2597 [Mucilaginibacter paludis DSM 18603]
MKNHIEEGDYVRHINPTINGGLQMSVLEIHENGIQAKCSHFSGAEAIHREDWFSLEDLILVTKGDGGFSGN